MAARRKRRSSNAGIRIQPTHPRAGHPGVDTHERPTPGNIRELYSEELVSEICTKYNIQEPQHVSALWSFLAFAASIYIATKERQGKRPRMAQVRAKLSQIARLSKKLRESLAALDEYTTDLLWLPQRWIGLRIYEDPLTTTEFGLRIVRQEVDETTHQFSHLEIPQFIEAISVIENYAKRGVSASPRSGAGAQSDKALEIWMINAQTFWQDQLGRPFTYDAHTSAPVSKALRFCHDALALLAPETSTTSIGTAMRKLIARKKRRTRKNPSRK